MQVFVANAWICAPQATDRDLESFFVNAWICTFQATDRDLESVFVKRKVNAWTCACQTFLIKSVTTVTPVTSVILMRFYCFFDLLSICNVCNLMQAYCFRIYFLLVTNYFGRDGSRTNLVKHVHAFDNSFSPSTFQ